MNPMSQAYYEEMILRAGMRVHGGNLTQLPHLDPVNGDQRWVAWAGRGMGLFVINYPGPDVVAFDAVALRDVIVCAVVLNEASTDFEIGRRGFDAEASDMTVIFIPRGEHFHFETRTGRGLRAVTVLIDPMMIMEAHGPDGLVPESLSGMIHGHETVMDKLLPGRFGLIALDIAARRGMFAPIAPLYYEGKALELMSVLLDQLSRQNVIRTGPGEFDPGMLERLSRAKKVIDHAPRRALDIAALENVAAMNRTKLRSSFKKAYGMTLSCYRTALLLQQAERALVESGFSVQQAAHRAGYANASSFIVAFKRHFGINPGDVPQLPLRRSGDVAPDGG
ncbi:AraC family transcriptional regulator [Rhizobium sp. BK251]|uniref:helix-turn-helix domain-containing protein n=1 Tax=Rhizobium sp. BK251 TaxID=2512125 RepID=UPI00104DFB08|nr:AraC family transcriptional regulator [Rhizobium sp. BK251]TCL67182.1 AraC-like DNA-binding protein [Rhizobium sp. BK251]